MMGRCTRKIDCECEFCERQREKDDEIRAERYCVACMQRLNDVTEPNPEHCPRCGIELDWTDGVIDGIEFAKRKDEDDRKWREWLEINAALEVAR